MARARLHPVHMLLVHFPAALLPMDFIFVCASKYFEAEALAISGYYCLLAGVVFGWLAVLAGLFDFFIYCINAEKDQVMKAVIHGCIQTVMLLGFTFVLSAEYKDADYQINNPTNLLIVKGILMVLMFAGNYFGGELVLRYISKRFIQN
jgi:uncharacterized membrane protein